MWEKLEYEYAGDLYDELREIEKNIVQSDAAEIKNSLSAACGYWLTIFCC